MSMYRYVFLYLVSYNLLVGIYVASTPEESSFNDINISIVVSSETTCQEMFAKPLETTRGLVGLVAGDGTRDAEPNIP